MAIVIDNNYSYLHLKGETPSACRKFRLEQRCDDQGMELLSSGQELLQCEYLSLSLPRDIRRARKDLAPELIELVKDNESTTGPKIKYLYNSAVLVSL